MSEKNPGLFCNVTVERDLKGEPAMEKYPVQAGALWYSNSVVTAGKK